MGAHCGSSGIAETLRLCWTGAVLYDDRQASAYDARYADRFGEVTPIVDFLVATAAGGPVLELGIGTGRLALPLAGRGLEVDGIDSSEAMVARLRDKPGGDRCRVAIGDFADVGSLVEGEYPLVFVAFNTLFELESQEDQVRCFAGVARHLAPGGVFVVEAFAPDLTRLDQHLSVVLVGTDEVRLQATRHDPLSQRVAGHSVSITDGGVGLWPWAIRYASVPELDLMARLAGLRLRERWSGWARQPFTAASTRHVSLYERP
jgi:SAM-dependent methyltransferase